MFQINLTITILRAALGDIFARPVRTLAVIWLPALLVVAGLALMVGAEALRSAADVTWNTEVTASIDPVLMQVIWRLWVDVAGVALMVVGLTWLAIAWHRHVLRDTAQPLRLRLVALYCLCALPLSLVISLPGAVLSIALGYISLVWIEASVLLGMYFAMRLSPVLPAAAIGAPVSFTRTWRRTRPYWAVAFGLVVLTWAAEWVAVLLTDLFHHWNMTGAEIVLTSILGAVQAVFSVALITQFYVHLPRDGIPA